MIAPTFAPTFAPAEEAPVLRTVNDLLDVIERLPAAARGAARDRIDAALAGDARTCRIALGVLALDFAAPVAAAPPTLRAPEVHILPLARLPATASA